MPKFYVYVSEYGTRIYANIFEAETKDAVKDLLLAEVGDWLPKVKLRSSSKGDNQYVTAIHEISGQWVDVFVTPKECKACSNPFTKIDKLKFNTGGRSEFCSSECDEEYSHRFDPYAVTSWDAGTVYKITHKPTGRLYIGVTTRWIMQRWWEHMKAQSGSPFHQLILASDITDFTFEILEVFKPSEQDPFEREAYYIEHYKAVEFGLNSVGGHKSV